MRARNGGALANPYVPSAPPDAPTVVMATAVPISGPGPYATVQAQPQYPAK